MRKWKSSDEAWQVAKKTAGDARAMLARVMALKDGQKPELFDKACPLYY